MVDTPAEQTQRIDKWLWFARIVKTRTLAAKLVSSGKVKVNESRVTKPSHTVGAGDTLTFMLNDRLRILNILATGLRRGPAADAQTLYQDLTPPPVRSKDEKSLQKIAARTPGSGRPTKKQRRELEKLRNQD